ncbi:MAG TPA: hypothetical protein VFW19_02860 [Allosphingosinicella sp.]|nr:hypothetical protein [Allosphingosinicella sp.]
MIEFPEALQPRKRELLDVAVSICLFFVLFGCSPSHEDRFLIDCSGEIHDLEAGSAVPGFTFRQEYLIDIPHHSVEVMGEDGQRMKSICLGQQLCKISTDANHIVVTIRKPGMSEDLSFDNPPTSLRSELRTIAGHGMVARNEIKGACKRTTMDAARAALLPKQGEVRLGRLR